MDTTITDTELHAELERLRDENIDLKARLAIVQQTNAAPDQPVRRPDVLLKAEAHDQHKRATAQAAARRLGTQVRTLSVDIPGTLAELKRTRRSDLPAGGRAAIIAAWGLAGLRALRE